MIKKIYIKIIIILVIVVLFLFINFLIEDQESERDLDCPRGYVVIEDNGDYYCVNSLTLKDGN